VLEAEHVLRADQRWQRADFYIEVSLHELEISLRERSVDVLNRVRSRKERHADRRQVVSAALQIELPPPAGLLDKQLCVTDVIVRGIVACNVVSLRPTDTAQNAGDRQLPAFDLMRHCGLQRTGHGRGWQRCRRWRAGRSCCVRRSWTRVLPKARQRGQTYHKKS